MNENDRSAFEQVYEYIRQEEVKFIRLAFFDVFGVQKNVSIMPNRLSRAIENGVAVDASQVQGMENEFGSDIFLRPDPATVSLLPWRSSETGVIHMISSLHYPDGTRYGSDPRHLLRKAAKRAWSRGLDLSMAAKFEFYLFELDNRNFPTRIPFDEGTYMDVAPADRGENVRRDICLTMEEMGLEPQKSYHQAGPGQNEIDFHFADPLTAADDASIFKWIVRTCACNNGLHASFEPKPLKEKPGSGMHVQIRLEEASQETVDMFMAGLIRWMPECILFCCSSSQSYQRLGTDKAPSCVDWSRLHRNVFLRVVPRHPNTLELRLPDSMANPYLVYTLMIHAGLDGIEQQLSLPGMVQPAAPLASSLEEAKRMACASEFVRKYVPETVLNAYLQKKDFA